MWPPRDRPAMLIALTSAAVVVAVSDPATQSQPSPPGATLVSVAIDGSKTFGSSGAISDDGRYVAFVSASSVLVPADTNGAADVFLRDLGAQQTRRVSVTSDGAEGNSDSSDPALNADGRVVAFVSSASNLVPGDTNGLPDIFVHDRVTGRTERVSVSSGGAEANGPSSDPALSADGRYVVFTSSATTLAAGDRNVVCDADCNNVLENCSDVFLHDRAMGYTQLVSAALGGGAGTGPSRWPSISADGRLVAFWSQAGDLVLDDVPGPPGAGGPSCGFPRPSDDDLFVADLDRADIARVSLDEAGRSVGGSLGRPVLSTNGRWVAFSALVADPVDTSQYWWHEYQRDRRDAATRRFRSVRAGQITQVDVLSVTADGRLVLSASTYFRTGVRSVGIHDLRSGAFLAPPWAGWGCMNDAQLTPDGRWLVFDEQFAGFCGGGSPGQPTGTYALPLDADNDGMPDDWERIFGLDPTQPDAAADADGDGITNLLEWQAGTHPTGRVRRYLAEGAGGFFRTLFDLANPWETGAVVTMRHMAEGDDEIAPTVVTLAPASRMTVEPAVPDHASFATLVEADGEVVVERTMAWAGDSHAETAVAAPSTTWYLAEGATHSGFQLYYLVFNPQPSEVTFTVTFLRPFPERPIERSYRVGAERRLTIWVNQEGSDLAQRDLAAIVTATKPIVVERAMYRTDDAGRFTAGHAGAAVASPAERWYFAEGATGPLFDTYLLLANPDTVPAQVRVRFVLADGAPVDKDYVIEGQSRRTVWVDGEDPRLAGTSFGCVVTSLNGVPVVAERAMWWPAGWSSWYAAHVSAGLVAAGTSWALANARIASSDPAPVRSYLLVANPSSADARIRIRLLSWRPDGVDVTVPAESRYTWVVSNPWPGLRPPEDAVLLTVESLGIEGVPVVVELATYEDRLDRPWVSGRNLAATRLK